MALFESYERRIDKINSVLNSYGIASIEEAEKITKDAGLDVYNQIKGIQPICFENACWAYIVGAAIAIKKDCRRAADAAAAIGEGLQAFCIPGSVADQRKVGLGHGNLGKMLLEEETDCFAFLAGHESFAAAEGAIRRKPQHFLSKKPSGIHHNHQQFPLLSPCYRLQDLLQQGGLGSKGIICRIQHQGKIR